MTFLGDNSRKLWTLASVVACMVAFSGCDACDGGNILNVGGATLQGPDTVNPGSPAVFTVSGQIGTGKKCPSAVQLSYVEVNYKDKPLYNTPGASQGKSKNIKGVRAVKTPGGCRLRVPVRVGLPISPGRTDQHRVRVTATIRPPAPPAPPANATTEQLFELIGNLFVGEDSKIVTVAGQVTPDAPPVASFIFSQSPANAGQPLNLDARQSFDPDGSIDTYQWDFGNGFGQPTTSPTILLSGAGAGTRVVGLRVTDNRGAQTTSQSSVTTVPSGQAFSGGEPALVPSATGTNQPVTAKTGTSAYSADLSCDGTLTSSLTGSPAAGTAFPQPCTFAAPGFHLVSVRYTQDPNSSTTFYQPTTFNRLVQITPARMSARAAAAKRKASLSVPLSLSGAKLKRLGKLKLTSTSGTIRGLIATGSGKGKLPKGTPRRYRSALKTLASGRFALRFTGSASLDSTTIGLSGSATMLVRSRHSRKTQVCLSVKAAGGGGKARFKVLGATGRARGFHGSGVGPAISFDKGTGRSTSVTLTPSKGRAHRLSRTCRSLSRVLDGKKKHKR